MDYNSVYTYIEDEFKRGGPLVIYVAIGCSAAHHGPGQHTMQQYPPYLRAFPYPQICVLIDPALEMPPRAYEDVPDSTGDITFLPIQQEFHHDSRYGGTSTTWFLEKLVGMCNTRVKLIVQEFTGGDLRLCYPMHMGREILKHVMYDPCYSDGSCSPDLDAIRIYRDAEGGFIQPVYSPLNEIRDIVTHDVLKTQFRVRTYPIVHMIARFYRILCGREEPRDWCSLERMLPHLTYYGYIYGITSTNTNEKVREILVASVQDLCRLAGRDLSTEAVVALVESSGKELEDFWKTIVI